MKRKLYLFLDIDYFDIDYFGTINDTHGQDAVNLPLKKIKASNHKIFFHALITASFGIASFELKNNLENSAGKNTIKVINL